MQLFAIKPRLQQVEENLQISQSEYANQQSGVNKFRMKPNQFQKEKVCLFDIPVQDTPYRIMGTKIGIVTQDPINDGGYDPDSTGQLRTAVQLAIDVLKRASKGNERVDEFKYDCLEITESEVDFLSHKQQLQILNELTTLRKEINNLINHKDKWVEVITNDVVQQSKASAASRRGHGTALSRDDLQLTQDGAEEAAARMSTREVEEQIQNLREKTDPDPFNGRRPPPEGGEWHQYVDRPLSLEQQRAQAQDGQDRQDGQEPAQCEIDYDGAAQPKRRHSKYRPVAEFKREYQSEYQQDKLRPPQAKREPRDFIQENIDNQQYYRRGFGSRIGPAAGRGASACRDIHVDKSGKQYSHDQLTELMMRIHMQKLAYQAKAGKSDAYKQLIVAQQQFLDRLEQGDQKEGYDDVAQQALEELYKSKVKEQEQEELIEQLRETIRKNKMKELADSAAQSRHSSPEEENINAANTARLVENLTKSKMYKVVLPQFSKEYYEQIVNDHKDHIKKLWENYQIDCKMAPNNSIIISKLNSNYIAQFTQLCNGIFQDLLDNEIKKFVDNIIERVEVNTSGTVDTSAIDVSTSNFKKLQ